MNWERYEYDREHVTPEEYATWKWYEIPKRYFKVELGLILVSIPFLIWGFSSL